jgi:hypothetical protein
MAFRRKYALLLVTHIYHMKLVLKICGEMAFLNLSTQIWLSVFIKYNDDHIKNTYLFYTTL